MECSHSYNSMPLTPVHCQAAMYIILWVYYVLTKLCDQINYVPFVTDANLSW